MSRVRLADHATQLRRVERRFLLRGGLSLGALSLLAGCDLSTEDGLVDRVLWAMLRVNDRIQAALFDPDKLAATFRPDQITRPFKFNAYYPLSKVRTVDAQAWKMDVSGLVDDDSPWTLERLRALPQEGQITRHICVEGWSQIGQWSGVPLHLFLKRVGADLRARYVGFECFDDYSSSIDMASALHPQTILALDFEAAPLTPPWGAPLRLRIPTKLGFKNPKYISAITVTNDNPGGYWEDQGLQLVQRLMNTPAATHEFALGWAHGSARALPVREAEDGRLAALMRSAQAGDQPAYQAVLRACVPVAAAVARRQGVAPDRVDDVVQDVLLTIHRARPTYDPERPFMPWLRAIAQRRAIDSLRSHGRHGAREVHDELAYMNHADSGEGAGADADRAGENRRLREAIATLPAGQRQAVELLGLRERSLEEAARDTGRSKGALKVNLHRAIKALRGRMGDERDV